MCLIPTRMKLKLTLYLHKFFKVKQRNHIITYFLYVTSYFLFYFSELSLDDLESIKIPGKLTFIVYFNFTQLTSIAL